MVGNAAGPSGQLFRIGVLGVAAYLAGSVVHTIGLPPLLGMLLMGTVLRNTRSVVISGRYLALAADLRLVHLPHGAPCIGSLLVAGNSPRCP